MGNLGNLGNLGDLGVSKKIIIVCHVLAVYVVRAIFGFYLMTFAYRIVYLIQRAGIATQL